MSKVVTQAKLKYLRMSPRKVRLVIDLVRGMKAQEARAQLQFLQKAAARPIAKLLDSAIANALHNHDAKEGTLIITKATVDGGPIMYRWTQRAMGRATPIRKRTSHVVLVLEGEAGVSTKKKEEAEPVEQTKEKKESKKGRKTAGKKKVISKS